MTAGTTRRAWCLGALLLVATTAGRSASQDLDTAAALARLREYLTDYETGLGTLVADERLVQWPVQTYGVRQGGETVARYRPHPGRRHELVSEVAFVPLPADAGWLGYRHVLRVNGRLASRSDATLSALLRVATADTRARADAMLKDSARHNAGAPRTINLPSLPLELLRARHATRFTVASAVREVMNGCETLRVELVERYTPTIIRHAEGFDMRSHVTAWVEPASGRLCRADVRASDAARPTAVEAVVSVDFARHPELDLVVPTTMREQFVVPPRGRGEGEATYTNYRRFTTSARIVP